MIVLIDAYNPCKKILNGIIDEISKNLETPFPRQHDQIRHCYDFLVKQSGIKLFGLR